MSRYRTVHCLIWNDDKFPFISDRCQLLWFHLRTTPMSNPLGCYKASLEGLAAEKRWPLKRYAETFQEGLDKGFWRYNERFHVVYFPNHFKYNRPENPNVLKGWLKGWAEIPDCDLKAECLQQLKSFAEGWDKAFRNVLATFGVTFAKQEQEQEREQDYTNSDDYGLSTEVVQLWNATSGVRPVRKLDDTRKKHLRARLKEADWPWREALSKFPLPCFRNNGKWKPTIDWFLRPGTADKILEGKYDFEPAGQKELPPMSERLATDEDKRNYSPHG